MSILEDLTNEQVIDFVENALDGECVQTEGYNNNVIFTTICHEDGDSPKLYYNTETHSFYCFTHCGAIGSLADLTMRVRDCDFKDAMIIIKEYFGFNGKYHRRGVGRKKNKHQDKKEINFDELDIPPIPSIEKKAYAYRMFPIKRLPMWEEEGISHESIAKYDIRYDELGEKIIIPHFNWENGNIAGVRIRNLNKEVADTFGKYVPFYYKGIMYSHSLKYNLYGYWQNKEDIKNVKRVIIFEGEKGVLQMNSFFKNNPSIATCGSNLSYEQIKMLLLLGVEEFVFAYDKQYKDKKEELLWKAKIFKLASRIPIDITVSIIWDDLENGLLDYKDSPVDKGKKIFNQLLKNRIDLKDFIDLS